MTLRTWLRVTVTAITVGALFVPVVRNADSFPLSTQPMYATARDRIETLPSARGVDDGTGEQVRLSMALVADTDDPLIAQSRVRRAIRSGMADGLCAEIADRVATRADLARLDLVEVVTEQLDLIEFVTAGADPLSSQVHARCEVDR